jgi:Cu-Zn family superoxide dismutase
MEILEPNVTLAAGPRSLLDADGSAIVLHAMADDYMTDPAGNAGGRIACGVVNK